MPSDTSNSQSSNKSPIAGLLKLVLVVILAFGVIWGIKIYYRTPELRHYEVCHYPYILYRTFTVDFFKQILIDDPATIFRNSNRTTEFYEGCIESASHWKWLKSF